MLLQRQSIANVINDLTGLKDTGKRALTPFRSWGPYFNKTKHVYSDSFEYIFCYESLPE